MGNAEDPKIENPFGILTGILNRIPQDLKNSQNVQKAAEVLGKMNSIGQQLFGPDGFFAASSENTVIPDN